MFIQNARLTGANKNFEICIKPCGWRTVGIANSKHLTTKWQRDVEVVGHWIDRQIVFVRRVYRAKIDLDNAAVKYVFSHVDYAGSESDQTSWLDWPLLAKRHHFTISHISNGIFQCLFLQFQVCFTYNTWSV